MVPAEFSFESSRGDWNPSLSIANVPFHQAIETPVSGLILGLGTLGRILKNSPVLVGPFVTRRHLNYIKELRGKSITFTLHVDEFRKPFYKPL